MKASDAWHALSEFAIALLARILITPLSLLIPRDPTFWVIVGRENGKFLDNAKHFLCWMRRERPAGHHAAFLTEHADAVSVLRAQGVHTVRYPRPAGIWALLRAGTIVVDSVDQLEHGRVALMHGACFVQLWHGAPLKEIELPLHARRLARLPPFKRLILATLKSVTGRYRGCDYLVATSNYFTEHAFSKCFRARRIIATGYPRNDVILDPGLRSNRLVLTNVDVPALKRIETARANGTRIALYAPTFRKERNSPFTQGKVDLKRWAISASSHNYLLVLKLHPLMLGQYESQQSQSLIDISAASDIYPLLADVDLMITDYSSIFFDYLLVDRPVLFFPYDFDQYTTQDRSLLFDYDTMTPGPKLSDFNDLLTEIPNMLDAPDRWAAARQQVRSLVFDNIDASASERIWRTVAKSHDRIYRSSNDGE